MEREPCLSFVPCGERNGPVEGEMEETSLYEGLDEVFCGKTEDSGKRGKGRWVRSGIYVGGCKISNKCQNS
jgi:hypothetical protein